MDPVTANPVTAPNIATSSASQPAIGEEFNSFIQLLTAQIRNQDPLAPLDSTQFVEQLATFSSLEQQVRSNTSLDNIAFIMSDLHGLIASEWIGQDISVESSWIPYSGDPIEYTFDKPADVDRAVLSVRDGDGNVTWTETLDLEDGRYTWAGVTQSGETVPVDSLLQFNIDLYQNGQFAGSVAPRVSTTVTDVATENGKLRFGTALQLTADIQAVRKQD